MRQLHDVRDPGCQDTGMERADSKTEPVWKASNYAVFTWLVVGCGSFQYCQYMRSKEKDGMRQARELMEKKRATIEAKKEARRRMKVEQAQLQEERKKEEARKKTWSYWIDKNVRFW